VFKLYIYTSVQKLAFNAACAVHVYALHSWQLVSSTAGTMLALPCSQPGLHKETDTSVGCYDISIDFSQTVHGATNALQESSLIVVLVERSIPCNHQGAIEDHNAMNTIISTYLEASGGMIDTSHRT
jgi:hypothetical protein